jgi:alkylation response protein AidB-like acyl-CoA dehydrogenase
MNHVSLGTIPVDPVSGARDLGPALAAAADEIERSQTIPEPLLSQIHEARLARMLLPLSVGGDQVEPWVYLRAIEEISRHDGSVGWNLFVANSAALIAPFIPLETARAIYADPRTIIAWGPPNQHKAQAVAGGYRVTGDWNFASGSRQANWMGAHCQVVEPDGSLRLNRFGRPTTRTLLFRKEHTQQIKNWNTIGMRGTASEGYRVTDLFVPESHAAAGHWAAVCFYDARALRRRRCRRRVRHRPRHAGFFHRTCQGQDSTRAATACRQRGRAGGRGAAGGCVGLRSNLAN